MMKSATLSYKLTIAQSIGDRAQVDWLGKADIHEYGTTCDA